MGRFLPGGAFSIGTVGRPAPGVGSTLRGAAGGSLPASSVGSAGCTGLRILSISARDSLVVASGSVGLGRCAGEIGAEPPSSPSKRAPSRRMRSTSPTG